MAQIEEVSKQAEKSGNSKEKEKKLQELLVKSFPVIKIKQLRPVRITVWSLWDGKADNINQMITMSGCFYVITNNVTV